ncbi:hypothetical protein [Nocardioides coralli]|nr:hypothetical protein [Nocardioides coralli]
MNRKVKLVIAALVTTLAATLGTAGVATTAEAGKSSNTRTNNWCC